MRNIHVAVDDSSFSLKGIALGEALAKQLSSELVLSSVVTTEDSEETRAKIIKSNLEKAGLAYYQDRLRVSRADSGRGAAEALAALASEKDNALLCMTSHGRRGVTELLMGSVTADTIRRSNALVFLSGPRFRADAHQRIDTLMVCVDGSTLAEAIIPEAVSLAGHLDARLQLLEVLAVKRPSVPAMSELPQGEAHGDVMESAYVHGLARRIRDEHGFEVDWEVLHGYDPAEAIVSYLADQSNVMVIMTTHGRSGLSQLAAGSVSHEILHEASCPVAVMRPLE